MSKNKLTSNQKITRYGSYAILLLLVVSFVGAPLIRNNLTPEDLSVFGKYDGKEIKYAPDNHFGQGVQNALYRHSLQYPDASTNQFLITQSWRQGFDQAVLAQALLNAANNVRFTVTENALKDIIAKSPELIDDDGNFDREKYNSLDSSTKNKFVNMQEDIAIITKVQDITIESTFLSQSEIDFYKKMNSTQKAFSYVRFEKNKVQDKQILLDFAKNNMDLFKSIEYKTITLSDEKEAKQLREKIISNESTFDEAVAAFSIDTAKENNGNRGSRYLYDIKNNDDAVVLDTLLTLKVGDLSEVVTLENGNFVLYELASEIIEPDFAAINIAKLESLDEKSKTLIDEVEDYMLSYETGIIEDAVQAQADQFIEKAKSSNFTTATTAQKLEIGTMPLAPLNVNNVDLLNTISSEEGPGISTLTNEQDILSEIYTLSRKGDISTPYVIDNYIYVFKLTDIATDSSSDVAVASSENSANSSTSSEDTQTYSEKVYKFFEDVNSVNIRNAMIDKAKLDDNFSRAFNAIYQ